MTELVLVEKQPMAGRVLRAEDGLTIGREGCDIVLPDPEVSRKHAVLHIRQGRPAIEDLGSTNGTFVNERPAVGATSLGEGDVVRLGNTIWTVQSPAAVTRVATPKVS
jgi:pSer/pThr/pTyr-binding forkhead associated (FHA) protein